MPLWRLFLATILFACAPALAQIPDDLTEPGQLPPSTGFADPDDISVLLDYRLPDWWSRTWTANVDMDGDASNSDQVDGTHYVFNTFALDLATNARWDVEGERTQARLLASLTGSAAKNSAASNDFDSRVHGGDASAHFDGWWRRYFTDSWSIGYGGGGSWSYTERIREEGDEETREFGRSYRSYLSAGIGYGRIRNVSPAIRAARLNERLLALGYEPLATADVLRVAEGLSRQAAYSRVFARPDRRFWADVLSPVTAREGLSPFEIYYLAEVLQENVGSRFEGWQIDVGMRAGYEHWMYPVSPTSDLEVWEVEPRLAASWSHNISLDHQLSARGGMSAMRRDPTGAASFTRRDIVIAELELQYLWAVADRVLWTTTLGVDRDYDEMQWDDGTSIQRDFSGGIGTSCTVYVEDRLALIPSVSCRYDESDDDAGRSIHRFFNYALTFSYDLDSTLN